MLETGGEFLRLDKRDVLLREVDGRFDMREQADEPVAHPVDLLREGSPQLRLGDPQAAGGLGADGVQDRFGLGQVQPSVEKRALRELARFSQPGSPAHHRLAYGLQNQGTAMAMNLHDVLGGVGMRGAHDDDQRFVNGATGVSRRRRVKNVGLVEGVTLHRNERTAGPETDKP